MLSVYNTAPLIIHRPLLYSAEADVPLLTPARFDYALILLCIRVCQVRVNRRVATHRLVVDFFFCFIIILSNPVARRPPPGTLLN